MREKTKRSAKWVDLLTTLVELVQVATNLSRIKLNGRLRTLSVGIESVLFARVKSSLHSIKQGELSVLVHTKRRVNFTDHRCPFLHEMAWSLSKFPRTEALLRTISKWWAEILMKKTIWCSVNRAQDQEPIKHLQVILASQSLYNHDLQASKFLALQWVVSLKSHRGLILDRASTSQEPLAKLTIVFWTWQALQLSSPRSVLKWLTQGLVLRDLLQDSTTSSSSTRHSLQWWQKLAKKIDPPCSLTSKLALTRMIHCPLDLVLTSWMTRAW